MSEKAERDRKLFSVSFSFFESADLVSCRGVVEFKINDISGKTIIIGLTTPENFKNL